MTPTPPDELTEIRREKLKWLRNDKFRKLKQKEFAKKLDVSPSQLGQWLSGNRSIGEHSARNIEAACRMAPHWLDGTVAGNEQELSPMAKLLGAALDNIEDELLHAQTFTRLHDELTEIAHRANAAALQEVQSGRQPRTRPARSR